MKNVAKLLNGELLYHQQQYAKYQRDFKDHEDSLAAKKLFKKHKKHIAELRRAIKILNEATVKRSVSLPSTEQVKCWYEILVGRGEKAMREEMAKETAKRN